MTSPRRLMALLALSVTLAAAPVSGAIYKWVDEDGVTHYSQQPRPTGDAKQVEVDKPNPAETERAQQRLDERLEKLKAQEEEQNKAQKKAAEEEKIAAAREENCRRARAALKTLTEHRRLLTTNEAGETVRMSEEERQAKVAETRKQIDEYCE